MEWLWGEVALTHACCLSALSQAWCTSNSDEDFDMLEKYIRNLKPEEMILVRGATQ